LLFFAKFLKPFFVENYGNPVNILLVEDNPADVELTRQAFKECRGNVSIDVAYNAMDALHYLRSGANPLPMLILLDLNLPGWDGKNLLREIKSDSSLRKIPIIILTTSNSGRDVAESYSLQANCYIVKPLDVDVFFETVKRIEQFWLNTALLPIET
jgi:chemotaxis family two-component system response regulator Rcp1